MSERRDPVLLEVEKLRFVVATFATIQIALSAAMVFFLAKLAL